MSVYLAKFLKNSFDVLLLFQFPYFCFFLLWGCVQIFFQVYYNNENPHEHCRVVCAFLFTSHSLYDPFLIILLFLVYPQLLFALQKKKNLPIVFSPSLPHSVLFVMYVSVLPILFDFFFSSIFLFLLTSGSPSLRYY